MILIWFSLKISIDSTDKVIKHLEIYVNKFKLDVNMLVKLTIVYAHYWYY